YRSRRACPRCGTDDAVLLRRGQQSTIRCARCDRFLYNAPKIETGERRRTLRTLRRSIRPKQQARILNRDRGRCVLCGSRDELTIGQVRRLEDGDAVGADTQVLYDDSNLAAMCEACNIGLRHGPRSITPRTYVVILFLLVQAERRLGEQTELDLGDFG